MGTPIDTTAIGGCRPEAAICTRAVTRDFQAGQQTITVLHGIDLDIRAGELTFLVGESGSGKTTLISIMCGILWPTQGEVKVFGTDIYELSDSDLVEFRLQNIGFIFQQYNLIPSIDAANNAAVPLIAQGMDRFEARERAVAMLEKLNIGDQAESCRASFRADNSNVSPLPARWFTNRGWWCATSRPRPSMRRRVAA